MQKLKKQIILLLSLMLGITLLFTSCKSDETDNPTPQQQQEFSENFGSSVNRDFMGKIVDESNLPINGVLVSIGGNSYTTDVNGIFIIDNASVHEKFAYITAKKTGYLMGSRSLVPTDGVNKVKIMLLAENLAGTVASGSDSEVSLANGTIVKFDGSFVDENGNDYSGSVDVFVHHLASSDSDINSKMPGMLYAQNENNDERMLETYGMINVELRGGGSKLNIAEGHKAIIELPIDVSQANAPNTIDLWHFDEVKGYWIQDGSATKQGNKYVGEVSHFSWWNCDAPFPTVTLCLNITDNANVPLANIRVDLSTNTISPRVGFTDGNGNVCGLIPSNEVLNVTIYDICNNAIYTTTIGPFSADTNESISLSGGAGESVVVSGNLLDCSNANVVNGYVLFEYGNSQVVTLVTNGLFEFSTLVCSGNNAFTIEGIDISNAESSGILYQTFTVPTTDLGNVFACGSTISEYISYQINNEAPQAFFNPGANVSGSYISMYEEANNGYITIQGNSPIVGVYNTPDFDLSGIDVDYNVATDIQFTLSNVGAVGEYIDLTFVGTYTSTDGNVKNITGTVHVLRDY